MTILPGSLWARLLIKRCLWCWLITNYGGDGNWCCYHSATIPFDKNAKSTWTIESLKGLSAFSIVSESLKANTMKRFTNSLRHVYHNPQGTPGHVLCLWLFSPGKGKYFTWDWILLFLAYCLFFHVMHFYFILLTRQRVLLDAYSNAKSNQILSLKHSMIHDNVHYDVPLYNLGRGGAVFPLGAFWTVPPIVLCVAPPG